jgi:hypothetical protein
MSIAGNRPTTFIGGAKIVVEGDRTAKSRRTARKVASELRALGQQIVALKESIDERFVQFEKRIDERFIQFEKRIDEHFVQIDGRFTEVDRRFIEVDRRFTEVDRRFTDLKESVDKRFDKSDATLRWIIGLFSPVIIGILAIIIKMFFGP